MKIKHAPQLQITGVLIDVVHIQCNSGKMVEKTVEYIRMKEGLDDNSQELIKCTQDYKLNKLLKNSFLNGLCIKIMYLIGTCFLVSFFQIYYHCDNKNVYHVEKFRISRDFVS